MVFIDIFKDCINKKRNIKWNYMYISDRIILIYKQTVNYKGDNSIFMIHAVIFDMFETLITHYQSPLYFGKQIAEDAGIDTDRFQMLWSPTEYDRSIGRLTFEEVEVIRQSELFPYFDSALLSYEQGIQKPDEEIFLRCIK